MYSIVTVDGQEEAEKVLNQTVEAGGELIQSHIYAARHESPGEQQNSMLAVSVTRFTFIFNHPARRDA